MRHPLLAIIAAVMALAFSACGSSGGGCADDYDCPGNHICVSAVCQEFACRSDDDCIDKSLRCIQNQCVGANAVPPDASGPPPSTDI